MTGNPTADARAILDALQAAVDARDVDVLASLFDEPAVLIGTAGDGRDPDTRRQYLTAVATQPESLRWEWHEIVPFHERADALGFAAFGDIVVSGETGQNSAPDPPDRLRRARGAIERAEVVARTLSERSGRRSAHGCAQTPPEPVSSRSAPKRSWKTGRTTASGAEPGEAKPRLGQRADARR